MNTDLSRTPSDQTEPSTATTGLAPDWVRWTVPLGAVLALVGYFGPWVDHDVAGLAILGLDLGEYVKFLTAVRAGQINIWREAFYLPLVAVSLICSLCVFRAELRYAWYVRVLLIGLAIMSAFNLVPPAWTPQRMLTPEFRQQLMAIGLCLTAMAFSPFLALLPRRIVAVVLVVFSVFAIAIPSWQFLRVLPEIGELYGRTLLPGWGLYTTQIGFLLIAAAGIGLWGKQAER